MACGCSGSTAKAQAERAAARAATPRGGDGRRLNTRGGGPGNSAYYWNGPQRVSRPKG